MYLKCIGGHFDGKRFEIKSDARIGDAFRFPDYPKSFDQSHIFKYYVYRVAVFNFSKDDTHQFLVPEGWTDKQSILHQFDK